MNVSSFSGFTIGMDSPSTVLSPSLRAKQAKQEAIDELAKFSALDAPIAVADDFVEPILRENPNRFTLFPIMKPKLFQKYKDHLSVFWVVEELDFAKDMKDWVKLSDNERFFIKNVLAFFAGSDGIVQENLASRFMSEVQLAEARQFYSVQLMAEAVHGETYSLLIDTYIQDKEEKMHLFQATQTIPSCLDLRRPMNSLHVMKDFIRILLVHSMRRLNISCRRRRCIRLFVRQ